MDRILVLIKCLTLTSLISNSQNDSLAKSSVIQVSEGVTQSAISKQPTPKKNELFSGGFIDFQNGPQMNASARIFKVYIGEPKKLMIPVTLYSGVTGNSFGSNTLNNRGAEQLVLSIINPTSGFFNISIDNLIGLSKNKERLTNISIIYQFGEKAISGLHALTFRNLNFFCTFTNTGFMFQTGAWEKNKEKNMGVFWLLCRVHWMRTGQRFLSITGYPPNTREFKGFSIGSGIEIDKALNIKGFFYRYFDLKTPIFEIPIFQLTFNYAFKN